MKWKILRKSLLFSLFTSAVFVSVFEALVRFSGFSELLSVFEADKMELIPPLMLILVVLFLFLTTLFYQLMRIS